MSSNILTLARTILKTEAAGIETLAQNLDEALEKAIMLLLRTKGNIVLIGVGKSGIVAKKIAATLTSLGSRALFLHPVEALHGDLGIIGKNDIAILISHSGTTSELTALLPHLHARKIPIIAITSNPKSTLAKAASLVINTHVTEEACQACSINLAPTQSTTVTLALGDVLALVLAELKGFQREDFTHHHPGGKLGLIEGNAIKQIVECRDGTCWKDFEEGDEHDINGFSAG